MKIRIGQCLCGPRRHAILGMAVQDETVTDAAALQYLRTSVAMAIAGEGITLGLPFPRINPWCGICRATPETWQYEVRWTKDYPDEDAAIADLRGLERDQQRTAAVFARRPGASSN